MGRVWQRFSLVVALCAVAACGKDATSPEDAYGTYSLTKVNGNAPPGNVVNTTQLGQAIIITWRTGTLNLLSDGTWNATIEQTVTFNGSPVTAPEQNSGTYTRSGNSFTFTGPDAPTLNGVLNGRDLTLTVDLVQFGFTGTATAVFTK